MAAIRLILHGKVARDQEVREAVLGLRKEGHLVEVSVTREGGDAARLTGEAVADAQGGHVDCIVAGGGDGTVNEVFAAAYAAKLPETCSLAILPLGTANDLAHALAVPVDDVAAALRLAVDAHPRWMDAGFVDGRLFVNVVSGGFGSRVTAETDPKLKERLGGLAYALTGLTHFHELSGHHGRFRADGFAWEGDFVAFAIGNGRQAGGGIPLCPDARIDDGLLDLTIVPAMDGPAYLDTFTQLLRDGAAGIQASLVTNRSAWIAYDSGDEINVNLDGEPLLFKRFQVEVGKRALPVRFGDSELLSADQRA
jgi:lipid kinase YegS